MSLLYQIGGLPGFASTQPKALDQLYPFSSIGNMPIVLPGILNLSSCFDTIFKNSHLPSVSTFLESTSLPVKLHPLAISDKLLIDACEFLNSIYEEMFQINELISLKKHPALIPEGICMFYNGYLIVNSL
jgi:hypothetical protein